MREREPYSQHRAQSRSAFTSKCLRRTAHVSSRLPCARFPSPARPLLLAFLRARLRFLVCTPRGPLFLVQIWLRLALARVLLALGLVAVDVGLLGPPAAGLEDEHAGEDDAADEVRGRDVEYGRAERGREGG